MNENKTIPGELAAASLQKLNRSVKFSNVLLDYLDAYQSGNPDPDLEGFPDGYRKLDMLAREHGCLLRAHIRHEVMTAWKNYVFAEKQKGLDVTVPNVSVIQDWMRIDFDIENLAEQLRVRNKEVYRLKPMVLYIAAQKGELKPGSALQDAFLMHESVWMYYVRWHRRTYHLFVPESKYGYYEEKYPNSPEHGKQRTHNVYFYPAEDLKEAMEIIEKYIENNQALLRDYPDADIGDLLTSIK